MASKIGNEDSEMKFKHETGQVPERTAEVAKKVFKKGNKYVQLREDLGAIFTDEQWSGLFSDKGRPGESPGKLALILVLQYMENLSDRRAAEQVGARLDWKYLLGLELEAEGIRFQKLSEFREKLVAGGQSEALFTEILQQLEAKGWLQETKVQRTDATWISSVGRRLNRLELVWEALSLLVEELAWRVPKWLSRQIDERWVAAYSRPLGWHKMPQEKAKQEQLALEIGQDGHRLWQRFVASPYFEEWYDLPRIDAFRRIWLQQYYCEEDTVNWRQPEETPPSAIKITSPFDLDARFSQYENSEGHVGYQVHFTETVTDRNQPQFITDVTTTPATTIDKQILLPIQQQLLSKKLAPETHLVDAGYISSGNLLKSQRDNGIHLLGPVPRNSGWQKRAGNGYALDHFHIDWQQQKVTCPEGAESVRWKPALNSDGQPIIRIRFSNRDCRPCPAKSNCTKSIARAIAILPQPEFEALAAARAFQETAAFKQRYKARAGVEALFSQAVNSLGFRRSRYSGLAKTHLHHILTAVAVNLNRLARWRLGYRRARPRRSPLNDLVFT